ncbi:gem-associated protein 8 [Mastomys coucha]|uniref:gem-associated protein 8 n=1 Tax=Mastomys coucha TaxID=35658 RepID=UPI0012629A62|nr:gem-associated protein 8 [Mastomys coucha]
MYWKDQRTPTSLMIRGKGTEKKFPLGLLQSEITAMASKWKTTTSWYSHPVYARYCMEITEELRQYFAQTERHREERRRQQQLDAERLNDYVNADHGLYFNHHRSVEPPSEKPWERRQAEMKLLYGNGAPKILAMEAAVQLSFDKHCDRKQPKYWPVIPLKF